MNWLPFNYIKLVPFKKFRPELQRYMALLLIPIFLMSILYININQVIHEQVEEYAELTVNFFSAQANAMLNEMQMVSSSILGDQTISRLLNADDPAEAPNDLNVCEVLKRGLDSSPFVQYVYLVSDQMERIYSDKGVYTLRSLASILATLGAKAADLNMDAAEDFHVLNDNKIAPYCIVPIHTSSGSAAGMLIVSLNMTEFLRIFYTLDAALCTIFNDDMFISSYIRRTDIQADDWMDESFVSQLVGEPVTCVYLEEANYTYLVAVSHDNYAQPLQVILRWFVIYIILAFIISFLYLYFVSMQRYRRFSKTLASLPEFLEGDSTQMQIFEKVRSSLEDYRTQLEYLRSEAKEHRLYELLNCQNGVPPSAEQFADAGIAPFQAPYYVVTFFFVELSDPALLKEHPSKAYAPLRLLLHSTVAELSSQAGFAYAFCNTKQSSTAILYHSDMCGSDLKENILALGRNAINILTESYDVKIRATISAPVDSVFQLPSAYQVTQDIHQFASSINSTIDLISQEELQHGSNILLNGDFIRQEQILINTILVQKYDAVPDMVDSILSTHIVSLRKNYALAQTRLNALSNILSEGVRTACLVGFDKEEKAALLCQADSAHRLNDMAQQVYTSMASHYQRSSCKDGQVAIACAYVADHLNDPNLSVSMICDAVEISPQRLTRMFKNQFGMAVAEYINVSRIKQAKALLADPSLTVTVIARTVGYSNMDTFTRNFRKLEGVTPSEYRKLL